MKTISEHEKERHQKEKSDKEKEVCLDLALLDEVESQDIPLNKDVSEEWREHLRELLRDRSFYSSVVRMGLACDHCGTELINPNPGTVLASNPPRQKVACVGCGWSGSMRC